MQLQHKSLLLLASILLAAVSGSAYTIYQPESLYRCRSKVKIDLNWKFYKGNPAGTPQARDFSDASWGTVSIPHSVSYDAPGESTESNHYTGIAWYRRTFKVPHLRGSKIFAEFEGAMQVAEVWLNGVSVGKHDIDGYTGFVFDLTANIDTVNDNVLAVKLDNTYSADIPPGHGDKGSIDFYLFSGLYRDVYLIRTDKAYIPSWGQQVSIDGQKFTTSTVSLSSPKIKIKTTVMNEYTVPKNCQLTYTLYDSAGTQVFTFDQSAQLAAGASRVFDTISGPVPNPRLWSPETPYLYLIRTTVLIDGKAIDDNVERVGIRSLAWSNTSGFSLNGARYQLRGGCLHQFLAWIENAVPNSRFYKDVELMKNHGCNAVRLSHYPRDPAFYEACDQLGLLVFDECTTWGWDVSSYSSAFWTRLNQAVSSTVTHNRNHPSIISYVIFNEPWADFSSQFTTLNNLAHAADSTRPTSVASNAMYNHASIPDLVGLNYHTTVSNAAWLLVELEYHMSWGGDGVRGGAQEATFAQNRWNDWQTIVRAGPRMAGGFFWSFNDYCARNFNTGCVDEYRIPKRAFYYFRKQWTGVAEDYATKGVGPATQIDLTGDLTNLLADGADICQAMATLRNASGVCVDTALPVTYTLTGPVDMFGNKTVTTIAGRIAAILKTRTTAGAITVIASTPGLKSDTVQLASTAVSEGQLFPTAIQSPIVAKRFSVAQVSVGVRNGALYGAAQKLIGY